MKYLKQISLLICLLSVQLTYANSGNEEEIKECTDCPVPIVVDTEIIDLPEGGFKVKLSWDLPAPDPNVEEYQVIYWAKRLSQQTVWAGTPYIELTDLDVGTEYRWEVRSFCGAGIKSAFSERQYFTTPGENPCPMVETGFSATPYAKSATLTWDAPVPESGTTIEGYQVRYWAQGVTMKTVSTPTNQITLIDLVPGLEYKLHILTNCGGATIETTTRYRFTTNLEGSRTLWAKASGSWNAHSTWTTDLNTLVDAEPPDENDTVYIQGHTVTVDQNASCYLLDMQASESSPANLQVETDQVKLTVSEKIRLNRINEDDCQITVKNGGIVEVLGN